MVGTKAITSGESEKEYKLHENQFIRDSKTDQLLQPSAVTISTMALSVTSGCLARLSIKRDDIGGIG